LSEAHLSKLLHEERLGTWQTLEFIIAALFPGGCRVRLEPLKPTKITPASIPEHQLKILRAYQRHVLATLASSGGHARAAALTRAERQAIGRHAMQVRWRRKRKLAPRTPQADGRQI
jgi:hypothetical protein